MLCSWFSPTRNRTVTIIWGLLDRALELSTNKGHHLLKGLVFGVFAWLVMMLVFMPIVSGGLFGAKLGYMAAAVTFLYHMAFGAALGLTFAALSAWVPGKGAGKLAAEDLTRRQPWRDAAVAKPRGPC